jgi:hypothetical protein
MSVPAQTAAKTKVVTSSSTIGATVKKGTNSDNGTTTTKVSSKVADSVISTNAAPKSKTVVAIAPKTGTAVKRSANSDNGTTATARAVYNRDVTA